MVDRVQRQSVIPASSKVNTARGGERQGTGIGNGRNTTGDYYANLGPQGDDQFEFPIQEGTRSFQSQIQEDPRQTTNASSKIYSEATGTGLNRTIVQPAAGNHHAEMNSIQDAAPFKSAHKQKALRIGDSNYKGHDYLNQTHVSKESGTNVSYQSNYSAIKSNILRFKNKRMTTAVGMHGGTHHGT